MTNGSSTRILFSACRKRGVEADFAGGDVTSNGGVLLLRQVDRRLSLPREVARRLPDDRQRGKVRHGFVDMLRQRVFGIALGYDGIGVSGTCPERQLSVPTRPHGAPFHDIGEPVVAKRNQLVSQTTLSHTQPSRRISLG